MRRWTLFQQNDYRPVLEDGEALEDADHLERLVVEDERVADGLLQGLGNRDPEHCLASVAGRNSPTSENLQILESEVVWGPPEDYHGDS